MLIFPNSLWHIIRSCNLLFFFLNHPTEEKAEAETELKVRQTKCLDTFLAEFTISS